MVDGIQIVYWLFFGLMGAVMITHVWILIQAEDPKKTLGRGAIINTWLYAALLVQSLNMALRYQSTWLTWLFFVVQASCLLIFIVKIRPLFLQHLRDVGLMSAKKKHATEQSGEDAA